MLDYLWTTRPVLLRIFSYNVFCINWMQHCLIYACVNELYRFWTPIYDLTVNLRVFDFINMSTTAMRIVLKSYFKTLILKRLCWHGQRDSNLLWWRQIYSLKRSKIVFDVILGLRIRVLIAASQGRNFGSKVGDQFLPSLPLHSLPPLSSPPSLSLSYSSLPYHHPFLLTFPFPLPIPSYPFSSLPLRSQPLPFPVLKGVRGIIPGNILEVSDTRRWVLAYFWFKKQI